MEDRFRIFLESGRRRRRKRRKEREREREMKNMKRGYGEKF